MINSETLIPFGKHLWKPLKDIPKEYWDWLMRQEWFIKSTLSYNIELKNWINENKK